MRHPSPHPRWGSIYGQSGHVGCYYFCRNQKFHIFAGGVSRFGTSFETEIGGYVKAAAIKGEDKNVGWGWKHFETGENLLYIHCLCNILIINVSVLLFNVVGGSIIHAESQLVNFGVELDFYSFAYILFLCLPWDPLFWVITNKLY